jgi:hypothetical protein
MLCIKKEKVKDVGIIRQREEAGTRPLPCLHGVGRSSEEKLL